MSGVERCYRGLIRPLPARERPRLRLRPAGRPALGGEAR